MRGLLIGIGVAVAVWAVAIIALVALGRRSQARERRTRGPLPHPRRPGRIAPTRFEDWLGRTVVI